MRFAFPFRASAGRSLCAVAALALLAPIAVVPSRAQTDQHAALSSDGKTEAAKPDATQPAATADATNPPQPGVAAKAFDRVKQAAKSASDIFNRVPCHQPKGVPNSTGSLPHVAAKLAAGKPVVIIAFGSSSTQGYGSSAPEFTYPNRLAGQLRRQYPSADITVLNRGKGGEDAPEMMKRLQTEVIDVHPDMVIWQVGTNAVLRNLDPTETAKQVEDGVARLQASGADVVLVDPQYSPRVTERPESARGMVKLLGRIAALRHVGIFPRFEVMRDWHEKQAIPITDFVIADGLHMNDWGYACFAQLLGDDIIRSVGAIKIGVNVPADVRTYRPM
ncbi:SGNH/GDSL hydrolase family protein [Bradyrhizobium australafricanum]|uniref:SGNH/GDSL hydrolase family protein n=1 Tax=Bradyrhizobium australafricanum TaxID=2821406 RepID=UPI001CE2BE87|nr:SGNH/GDSL hydrolase family protein [Bradyrhizobium australafricanum]MCA6103146.1 SGNH/GDSL hydrolase family protein [Bradyrhizobium australafricanum]